ncbi:hypothetical protein HDU96_002898 [Phlyctochytrium bullatum]|nr:hypothetical protein HDU96_002898 [Phlyctochytrium bullatum]
MKLSALAITIYLGLTAVAATPFPKSTDDLDILNNIELPDLSATRAVELAYDASDYSINNDEDKSDAHDASNGDLESFGLSRVQKEDEEKFDFDNTVKSLKKYVFISIRITNNEDWAKAETDFKKQCDEKFPANKKDKKNQKCKNDSWPWKLQRYDGIANSVLWGASRYHGA